MAKRFPKVRCSEVTVKTVKHTEHYIVPSETADQAIAQFRRPDAIVQASGNLWAQVTETDGETFQLALKDGSAFTLEPGDPGYDRVRTAHSKVLSEIDQDKLAYYGDDN